MSGYFTIASSFWVFLSIRFPTIRTIFLSKSSTRGKLLVDTPLGELKATLSDDQQFGNWDISKFSAFCHFFSIVHERMERNRLVFNWTVCFNQKAVDWTIHGKKIQANNFRLLSVWISRSDCARRCIELFGPLGFGCTKTVLKFHLERPCYIKICRLRPWWMNWII